MKFAFWGFVFGLLLQSCLSDNKLENKVIFAPKEKAKKLLQTEDEFTNSWSQFDIYSRVWETKSSKSELIDCTMILYANSEYTGGDFFRYLRVGFLILKGTNIKEIEYINGNPIIYSREEVKGFYEKVGRNTRYTIHPEEILAENFVYTFFPKENLPNPEIVNMISARLK